MSEKCFRHKCRQISMEIVRCTSCTSTMPHSVPPYAAITLGDCTRSTGWRCQTLSISDTLFYSQSTLNTRHKNKHLLLWMGVFTLDVGAGNIEGIARKFASWRPVWIGPWSEFTSLLKIRKCRIVKQTPECCSTLHNATCVGDDRASQSENPNPCLESLILLQSSWR